MTRQRTAPEMLLRPQPRLRCGRALRARERIPPRRAKAIRGGAQGPRGSLFPVPAEARSSVLTPVRRRGMRDGRGWRTLVDGSGAARNHNRGNSMLEDQLLLIVSFQHQRVFVETLDAAGQLDAA